MIGALLSIALAGAPVAAQAKPNPTVVMDAARCVVEFDRRNVVRLLDTLPGSTRERRLAKLVADMFHACSEGKLTGGFDGRAALAAALVEAKLRTRDGDFEKLTVGTPWYSATLEGATAGKDYDPVALGIQEFGTCVVRAAPQGSADLLGAMVNTVGEATAALVLKPVLPGCIVAGQTLRFDPFDLRLMLAEPFYHAALK